MKRLRQKERFTIENPGAINSLNMCMSGHHIEIIYLTHSLDEYIYKITHDKGTEYLFKINRYKRDDKNVNLIVSDYTGALTKYFAVSYRKLTNKNEFQDWLVKRAEEKFNTI
jgi:hypothetical protein